jgi:hypothetical protein
LFQRKVSWLTTIDTPQLRDIWTAKISDGEIDQRAWKDEEAAATHAASQEKGAAVIEVSDWLTRLTLDAIGKGQPGLLQKTTRDLLTACGWIETAAGFGYDFRALCLESDALAQAFASLFSPSGDPGHPHPFTVLINTVIGACLQALPTLKLAKLIPNERIKAVYAAFDTIQTESAKIIKAKREEAADKGKDHEARKDLISILRMSLTSLFVLLTGTKLIHLHAVNNAEKEKLDDEELRGQLTVSWACSVGPDCVESLPLTAPSFLRRPSSLPATRRSATASAGCCGRSCARRTSKTACGGKSARLVGRRLWKDATNSRARN